MSEWKEYRLKDICDMFGRIGFRGYKESDIVEEGNGCITLSPSNMTEKGMNYSHCKYLSWFKYHESPEIQIQNGDVLFVKTGSSYGKTCYVDNLPLEATINPQILVLKNIKLNNKFFSLVLKTENILTQVKYGVVGSTIPTISQEKIGQFRFNTPSLSEQQRIVDYLDEKTNAIDGRISVLEKKSDAYTRLKASVINRAVTRGLNHNVPLKDSSIEWIGMIPEHWEVKRMKEIFSERKEVSQTGKEDLLSVSEYYGVARRKDKMTSDEEFESRAESLIGYKICKANDLVMNIMLAWKTGLGISDYDGIVSPAYAVYEGKGISPHYYHYLLRTGLYVAEYKRHSKGIIDSRLRLYNDRFNNVIAIYPPLSEQQSIASYLDIKCSEIDKAIDNLCKQIEALKRLKRSLINEVVTGKRKV